jgi:ATP adenylyltransferase/5',5'''-P-1,P-4-tetraphosphate phosphorylase II
MKTSEERIKSIIKESFKTTIKESPKNLNVLLKEDFIKDFITAFITREKDKSLEREIEKIRRTNPDYYEALKDWNKQYQSLLQQLELTFPKITKAAGPYDMMATREYMKKSTWAHGGN